MAMTKENIPATVGEYLNALPADVRSTLEKVRKAIKEAAPKAEEVISYHIPTYKYLGTLVHFAAFKDHCSFFGASKRLLESFKEELQPYNVSGTTIHFRADKPLPSALVKKLVKARIKENEERVQLKNNQSAKKTIKKK